VTLRMTWSGDFGAFVQQRMKWPLVIAGLIVVAFAAVDLVTWLRSSDDERRAAPGVAVLMVVPVLTFVAVAPSALGAAAADRVDPYEPPPPSNERWGLPDDDPLEMRVVDFVNQVLYDPDQQLTGRRVVLEGLVVNDPDVPDGFLLVRFLVSCCAADGLPLKIALHDAPDVYDDDTWVRATVTWRPPPVPYDSPDAPRFIAADVIEVEVFDEAPDSPYESPF
ncbi:MAG: TIGR03943 family protein, partial [Actinomycetota bacterium]